MEYIEHILKSIKINYKTWLALFSSCLLLYPQNLFLGIILYIICILQSYWAHRLAHEQWAFFLNRAHIYHHENSDAMSHIVQVGIETLAVFSPFIFIYFILDIKETIYPLDPYLTQYNKENTKKIIFVLYSLLTAFVGFYTFKQCFIDISKHYNQLHTEFDNNIQSILNKLI